jgi:hypothetical protein
MNARRRASKEPEVPPASPFAPVVAQARTMARGLAASIGPDDEGDASSFVRGKIEGIESVVLLCQRAGAGETITTEDGQRLVKLAHREEPAGASLEARVARLEAQVRQLTRPAAAMPAILEPPKAAPRPPAAPKPRAASVEGGKVGAPARKVLTALAQHRGGVTKARLAILTGYAVSGGGFSNLLSALRTRGLIAGAPDDLRITDAGLALGPYPALPTGDALLEYWMAQTGKAGTRILYELASVYPRAMAKPLLATRAGYAPDGGGFNNKLSELRTLALIEGSRELRATDSLMQEGR